jgi:hypothetical protein
MIRSMSLKEAFSQNNRWIVADIDRKFLRPYHLISKPTLDEQLKERNALRKQNVSKRIANYVASTSKDGSATFHR